jgi:hypothetical protein
MQTDDEIMGLLLLYKILIVLTNSVVTERAVYYLIRGSTRPHAMHAWEILMVSRLVCCWYHDQRYDAGCPYREERRVC